MTVEHPRTMISIMYADLHDALRTLPHRVEHAAAREFAFRRGQSVSALLLVESGEIRLQRDGIDGQPLVLQRVSEGGLVAEASLHAERYHCDAFVANAARVRRIARTHVLERFRADSGFAELWCRGLASEIRDTRLRNEILRLRTVRARLDAWLAWQDRPLPPRGERLGLAHELGVSPEALYRELARRGRPR